MALAGARSRPRLLPPPPRPPPPPNIGRSSPSRSIELQLYLIHNFDVVTIRMLVVVEVVVVAVVASRAFEAAINGSGPKIDEERRAVGCGFHDAVYEDVEPTSRYCQT